jgi:hypothetical protein
MSAEKMAFEAMLKKFKEEKLRFEIERKSFEPSMKALEEKKTAVEEVRRHDGQDVGADEFGANVDVDVDDINAPPSAMATNPTALHNRPRPKGG